MSDGPMPRHEHIRVWGLLGIWVASVLSASLAASPAAAQDTVVVHVEPRPIWGENLTAVEQLRLGSIAGPDETVFGHLLLAAAHPNGELLTVDAQGPRLRAYDSEGRFIRDIGRRGQGPGEYSRIAGLRTTPGGDIAIWDPGNRRITVYEPDGTFARSMQVPSSLNGASTELFQVDTSGVFYVRAATSIRGSLIGGFGWIRVSPTGAILDTLPIPPAGENGRPLLVHLGGEPLKPFTIETTTALSPHGYLIEGRTDSYTLLRPRADGRILRLDLEGARVPLEKDERAQWEAFLAFLNAPQQMGGPPFPPVPAEKPFFRSLWVDASARIWVRRYVHAVNVPTSQHREGPLSDWPTVTWREPSVWDVLEPEGKYLGTLTLPIGARPVAAEDRTVWAVERGEYDEHYLVRYRIQRHP